MDPGSLFAERYLIERLAGSGGAGTVYQARELGSNGSVALKVMLEMGASELERFEREAAVLAGLDHPSIVRYVGHGWDGDRPFLAMEWLDGEDLQQRLIRQGLSLAEVLALGQRVASALATAHRTGIVHRDVKPSNLFLPGGSVEQVKVLDFGHAHLRVRDRGLTRTGTVIGTPAYMAPEQARGARSIDGRADLFSLGCVLFECLTGRPAFVGEHQMAVLARILLEDPPRLQELMPGLPYALDLLIARMLAKNPEDRQASAEAVLADLQAIERGDAPPAPERLRPAITATEQRMLCAVMAAPAAAKARTWSSAAEHELAQALDPVVAAHGCRLDLLWDGSMLITLMPEGSATDQATRAARCALAVHSLLPDVGMVVVTGRAVLSDRMPIGEVLDRGVRTLRGEHANAIRVDDVTAGLLEGRFELVREGDSFLLGAERQVESLRTLCGQATPFVGRERELGTLLALWEECTGEPVARAVLVTGAAGMGKSRLRDECVRAIRTRWPEAQVLFGRGDLMRAGSSLGVLGGTLRAAAGILEGEPLEVRQRKLRAWIAADVPPGEVDRYCEAFGEIMGVCAPGPASAGFVAARQNAVLMADTKRAAFEAWLRARTARAPVLLVLEDLHWGDRATVRFIDGALRRLHDRPLMVLAVARPELRDEIPDLWSGRDLVALHLGKLLGRAAERLVRSVLGDRVDADTVARVIEQADGNVFYLEELVRAVAEGADAAVSPTVIGILQSRLDALGVATRRVLRAASVFGQRFWPDGVAALIGGTLMDVERCLGELVRSEVIVASASTSYPGRTEYAFRSAIVRDAAYAMLTAGDQTLGHRLAAEWLLELGEQDPMTLGQHFLRADELARAMAFFQRAAEQALEANDLWAALVRAELAVFCGAEGDRLGVLELLKAEANRWRGELADCERSAIAAASILPAGSAAWFRAAGEIVFAAGRQGHLGEVSAWATRAANQEPMPGARSSQVACLAAGARQLFDAGQVALAEELHARTISLAAGAPDLEGVAAAEVHRMRGARARHRGDAEADLLACQAALEAFTAAGDLRSACNAEVSLGSAFASVGELERARELLERAERTAEQLGLDAVLARAQQGLGSVLRDRGDLRAAREIVERAVTAGARQHDLRLEGWSRGCLAAIALEAKDLVLAEAQARRAVDLHAELPPARAGSLAMLARTLLEQGRADDALELAMEAHALLEGLGAIEEHEALVRLAQAEALAAAGRTDEARGALASAQARLLQRAGAIRRPEWRDGFLHRVRDHARTLALARAWGLGAAHDQ